MKKEFLNGIKDGMPICLGYFSVSVAFGMSVVLAGMPIWAAVLMSITNLTSAGQFAASNLLLAGGTFLEIALTTLIINSRYFLMSFSLSQKVEENMNIPKRMGISYGITDEIFAVAMGHEGPVRAIYMLGLIITPVLGWTFGTFAGGIATNFMPERLSTALGIAMYGMFIAIIIPESKKHLNVLATVIMAIALSILFTYAPVLKEISSGFSIIIITVAVSVISALLFPVKDDNGEESK